ncbi:MAG: ABC transporter substrate-binding protein [Faecousia sp.]
MKFTKILSLVLALAMVLSLAACGSKPAATEDPKTDTPATEAPATEAPSAEAPKSDVVLTYWSMWGSTEPQGQVIQAAADAYKEKTGVTVNIEWKNRDITTIIPTALEGGEKIDIFDDNAGTFFKNSKYCYDLTEMAAAAKYEEQSFKCFNDQAIENAGFLCCITEQPQVGGVYYNKDIFDACGITEVPATWDDFLNACQIMVDNGYEPLALDSAYIDLNFGYQLDRVIGREKTAELAANGGWSENEGVILAANQVIDFVNRGFLADGAPDEWPSSQNKIGLTGKVAMIVGANYIPGEVNNNTGADINWGMFNFPTYEGGSSNAYAGAGSIGITSYCEHPQEAFDFIMFLTSGEFDQKMADTAQQIPADPRNTAPAIMSGSIEALNATSNPLDWGMGIYESGDLAAALKEVMVKLYEGGFATGEEFAAAMDALY